MWRISFALVSLDCDVVDCSQLFPSQIWTSTKPTGSVLFVVKSPLC